MHPASAYSSGRELARGGMGAVLDARDNKLGRSVAMKVMLRRNASAEEAQRFLQEAWVLGQLAHPNIVPVHDVGQDEQGRLFFTMKLVQGVTLHEVIGRLKGGDPEALVKYSLTALLTIFQKVCDALAFAHSRGVIHRDLKPQNIMVGEFGEVLVMDWGLAKVMPGSPVAQVAGEGVPISLGFVAGGPEGTARPEGVDVWAGTRLESSLVPEGAEPEAGASGKPATPAIAPGEIQFEAVPRPSTIIATLEGAVMGTPRYMSPEQADGRISELDARSDIFSLGGILYALLTLRPPVEGNSVAELLDKVRSGAIVPPAALNGGGSAKRAAQKGNDEVAETKAVVSLLHLPGGRVPLALSAVAMKALAVQREARYPTVAALSADVGAYQGGFATSAENATGLTLILLFLRRHKTLAAAVALVVVLTIGFMAKVLASERKASINAKLAEHNERVANTNAASAKAAEAVAVKEQQATRQALAKSSIALAEAGLREGNGPAMQAVLNSVPEDLRDDTWLYLFGQSDTSIFRFPTGTNQIESIAAHPKLPGVFAIASISVGLERVGGGASGSVRVGRNPKVALVKVRTGERLLEFTPEFANPIRAFIPDQGFAYGGRYTHLVLAVSPDGERIAVGRGQEDHGGGIVIYSAREGQKLAQWAAPATRRLEFSPDGKTLLQIDQSDYILSLWDANGGGLSWKYQLAEKRRGLKAVFTPDGQHLVTSDESNSLRLVNAYTGALVRALEHDLLKGRLGGLAMHPDGKSVLAKISDGRILSVTLDKAQVRWQFRPSMDRLSGATFAPDGSRFFTANVFEDGRQGINCWDADSGALLHSQLGGMGPITQIDLHPLSGELLVAGVNSRVWELAGVPAKWTFPSATPNVVFFGSDDVAVTPAPEPLEFAEVKRLATDGSTVLWKLPGPEYVRNRASVSADGLVAGVSWIWAGGAPGVALLRREGAGIERTKILNVDATSFLRLSPTGDRFVSAAHLNGRLNYVETSEGKSPVQLDRTNMIRIWDAGWLNGERIVSVVTAKGERGSPEAENWIVLWDAATGKILRRATNHSAMDVLAMAPDGRRFAEAGADKRVRLRDPATLAVLQEFRAHDGPVTALAWHPSKPILATASADLSIRLWDLDTGRRLMELRGPIKPPDILAFSPSGWRLGCAAKEDGARIWDWESPNDRGQVSFNLSAAPPPVRLAEPMPGPDGWSDHLANLAPGYLAQHGNGWRMTNGVLFSPDKQIATLPLVGTLSGTSYTVREKLRKLHSTKGIHVVIPVADRMVSFELDGGREGHRYTGLTLVDGKIADAVPGSLNGEQVQDSEQHDLEVTVRLDAANAAITATLEARSLYKWVGPIASLSQHAIWTTPPGILALGTMTAEWAVYEVKVKRLDVK